jgi:hypothetical protein
VTRQLREKVDSHPHGRLPRRIFKLREAYPDWKVEVMERRAVSYVFASSSIFFLRLKGRMSVHTSLM